MKRDESRTRSPLSPAALHILLALAGEDLHGYAIMQEVSRQSEGRYKLGPGTLYDNLQKLVRQRFVEELGHRHGDETLGGVTTGLRRQDAQSLLRRSPNWRAWFAKRVRGCAR